MNKRLQQLEKICKEYHVTALYVFGSRALDALRSLHEDTYLLKTFGSDLDIGVFAESLLSVESKVSLALELEQLFNTPRVDLVILQEADAFLAANIIRGERLYVADAYQVDEYELYVLRRAGDLAELERERMAMILQRE